MSTAKNKLTGGQLTGWYNAAETLKHLRIETIRNSDTASAIEQLSDAFESAMLHNPVIPTSGMVEQQRLFSRWRR